LNSDNGGPIAADASLAIYGGTTNIKYSFPGGSDYSSISHACMDY